VKVESSFFAIANTELKITELTMLLSDTPRHSDNQSVIKVPKTDLAGLLLYALQLQIVRCFIKTLQLRVLQLLGKGELGA